MDLLSEEEQWERMKAWLRNSGPSVLVLTALILLGWFGWKWWQDHLRQQALAASATYQQMLANFDEGKPSEAFALLERLRSEHPKSPYVSAGDLIAANVYVGSNELDKAIESLQRVVSSARDEELRPVARLRLARVQSAKAEYDTALATLGTADMGPYESARLEVRGDVLFAKGDRAGALKEYQAARKLLRPEQLGEGSVGELLDLKIGDLGGTPAGASPEAVEAPDSAPAPAPAAGATPAPGAPAP